MVNKKIDSINTTEVILDGGGNNTAARLTFKNNELVVENVKTGKRLLTIDTINNAADFGTPVTVEGNSVASNVLPREYFGVTSRDKIIISTVNNNGVNNINNNVVSNPIVDDEYGTIYRLLETTGIFKVYKYTDLFTTGISFYVGETGTETSIQTENNIIFKINQSTGEYSAFIKTRIVQDPRGWNSDLEIIPIRAISADGVVIAKQYITITKAILGEDGQSGPFVRISSNKNGQNQRHFSFDSYGKVLDEQELLNITIESFYLKQNETIYTNGYSYRITTDPEIPLGGSGQFSKILDINKFLYLDGSFLSSAVIKVELLDNRDGSVITEDYITIYSLPQNLGSAKAITLTSDPLVFIFTDDNPYGSNLDYVQVLIKTTNIKTEITAADILITRKDGTIIPLTNSNILNLGDGSYSVDIYLRNSNYPNVGVIDAATRDSLLPLKVRVSKDGVSDTVTINKVSENGGLSGFLSDESLQIPSNEYGGTVSADYSSLNGTFYVFKGKDPVDPQNLIFSVAENNGMITTIDSNGNYQVTTNSLSPSSKKGTSVLKAVFENREIRRALSVTKNKQGESAKSLMLIADSELFVIDKNGLAINNEILLQIVKQNIDGAATVTAQNGSTLTTINNQISLTYNNFYPKTSETITATITVDGVTYTDSVTIKLSEWSTGTDAKTVKLESNDYQIGYNEDGEIPDPGTITLTATQQGHLFTPYYLFEVKTANNWTTLQSYSTSNTVTYSLPPQKFNTPISFRVSIKDDNIGDVTATDSISVVATKDGSNAITISVPNQNHTFPATILGTITSQDYADGGTDIEVYLGNTKLTAVDSITGNLQFTVSKNDNGITSTLSRQGDSKFVLSNLNNMTADSATVELTIIVKGRNVTNNSTYNSIITYSKSKKGDDSSTLFITPETNNFIYSSDSGVVTTNDTISVSIRQQNLTSAITTSDIVLSDANGVNIPVPALVSNNVSVPSGKITYTGEVAFNLKIDSISPVVNYANSDLWTPGNGSAVGTYGNFSSNGYNPDESIRAYRSGPFSDRAITWQAISQDGQFAEDIYSPDGGWNYSFSVPTQNQLYRSIIWVKRTSDSVGGSFWHGCDWGNTLTLNNSPNSNPYFNVFGVSSFEKDVWYLSVGYIHANNDPSTTNLGSGVYRFTGELLSAGTDYKMGTGTSQTHRVYLYYSPDIGTSLEFWGPRFEAVTSDTPTIQEILNGYSHVKRKFPLTITVTKDNIETSATIDKATGGEDGRVAFDRSIFTFSKANREFTNRPEGWKDTAQGSIYKTDILDSAITYAKDRVRLQNDNDSQYGGTSLIFTQNGHLYTQLIPVEKIVKYIFAARGKNSAYVYLIQYNKDKSWIDRNRVLAFESTSYEYKYVYIDPSVTDNTTGQDVTFVNQQNYGLNSSTKYVRVLIAANAANAVVDLAEFSNANDSLSAKAAKEAAELAQSTADAANSTAGAANAAAGAANTTANAANAAAGAAQNAADDAQSTADGIDDRFEGTDKTLKSNNLTKDGETFYFTDQGRLRLGSTRVIKYDGLDTYFIFKTTDDYLGTLSDIQIIASGSSVNFAGQWANITNTPDISLVKPLKAPGTVVSPLGEVSFWGYDGNYRRTDNASGVFRLGTDTIMVDPRAKIWGGNSGNYSQFSENIYWAARPSISLGCGKGVLLTSGVDPSPSDGFCITDGGTGLSTGVISPHLTIYGGLRSTSNGNYVAGGRPFAQFADYAADQVPSWFFGSGREGSLTLKNWRLYLDGNNACNQATDIGTGYLIRASSTGEVQRYTPASALRYKQNIRDIEQQEIDKLLDLKPVMFDFKEEHGGKKNVIGIIADELEKIFPNIATYHPDDGKIQYYDYVQLISLLIAKTKQQETTIKTLEEKFNELRAEIELLKNK